MDVFPRGGAGLLATKVTRDQKNCLLSCFLFQLANLDILTTVYFYFSKVDP